MFEKINLSIFFAVLIMLILLFVMGCEKKEEQPVLKNPTMKPTTFDPARDEELIASIEILDPERKIMIIELSFPQMPPAPTLILNDRGMNGDQKAEDGIWTVRVPLPQPEKMPKGEFRVEFKAIGKDNLPIRVKNSEGIEQVLIVETTVKFVRSKY